MSFRLDRLSEESPLSRILFYSVVLHYIIFFILFGNPFFITFDQRPFRPASKNTLDVDLLTPPPPGEGSEKGSSLVLPTETLVTNNLAVTAEQAKRAARSTLTKRSDPSLNEEISDPEQMIDLPLHAETASNKPVIPKKVVRQLPPNMTGPEDCLLKVVSMVCPKGEFDCIRAYKDFCSTLPD